LKADGIVGVVVFTKKGRTQRERKKTTHEMENVKRGDQRHNPYKKIKRKHENFRRTTHNTLKTGNDLKRKE